MTAPTPQIGRVVVDPRFRARRIAVRKEAGRKRLKRLLVLIVAAIVALAVVIVLKSPMLDVDEIVVDGTRRLEPTAIAEVAGIRSGEPVLLADLAAAEARIEALPWVAEATVTRELPDAIHVSVVERVATATLVADGGAVLVDGEGVVLDETRAASTAVFPPYVAVLTAEAAPEAGRAVSPELLAAVELAGRLRENPPSSVVAVALDPAPRLELVGGGRVEFGDLTQLDDKVEAFRTMWARVDRTCLDTIDLRVPSHPVLTRFDRCS